MPRTQSEIDDRLSGDLTGSDSARFTPNTQDESPTQTQRAEQVVADNPNLAIDRSGDATAVVPGPAAQTTPDPTPEPEPEPEEEEEEEEDEGSGSSDSDTITPKWDAYSGAMSDMWEMYNKSEGQWGDIDSQIGESTAEQKAQAEETGRISQSRMDRRAAEEAAMGGQRMGGGSSQAGAAQANITGRQQLQQHMTDISQWGSEAKMSNVRNMIASRDAMIGRMHSNAQQMASLASSAEEGDKARKAMADIEAARRETDILTGMINSGNIEDPDEIMRLVYEGGGS